MEQKFYICKHCGNIIVKIKDSSVPVVCCGEPMSEIVPGVTDAAVEKHVPVWSVENGIVHVKVGSVEHPMLPEHFIEWIHLETENGAQIKHLKPGETPEAVFMLAGSEKPVAAFAYCNLHGLWKAEFHED
jgi:superoxide reductase